MAVFQCVFFGLIILTAQIGDVGAKGLGEKDDDDMAAESIKEMMGKLDSVLRQQQQPQHSRDAEPVSTPCYDVTSGRSVVTQICDKISSLEGRLAKTRSCPDYVDWVRADQTETKKKSKPSAEEQEDEEDSSDDSSTSKSTTDNSITLTQLKEELEKLQRKTVFFARQEYVLPSNVTHQRLQGYQTTVNKGFNFFPNTGEFKALYQGIYHFSLSFLKAKEFPLEACLVVDDQVIATARDDQQAYIDLMTPLEPGQKVWADVTTTNLTEDNEVTLTFSGYLVN